MKTRCREIPIDTQVMDGISYKRPSKLSARNPSDSSISLAKE